MSLQDSLKGNTKKEVRDQVGFLFAGKTFKVFYKLIPAFFLAIAMHAQRTQNSKFAISLQNL